MSKVIHIEICKSFYKDGTFNLRIGNIRGSTEHSNITKEVVLEEILDEINKLGGEKE